MTQNVVIKSVANCSTVPADSRIGDHGLGSLRGRAEDYTAAKD